MGFGTSLQRLADSFNAVVGQSVAVYAPSAIVPADKNILPGRYTYVTNLTVRFRVKGTESADLFALGIMGSVGKTMYLDSASLGSIGQDYVVRDVMGNLWRVVNLPLDNNILDTQLIGVETLVFQLFVKPDGIP